MIKIMVVIAIIVKIFILNSLFIKKMPLIIGWLRSFGDQPANALADAFNPFLR